MTSPRKQNSGKHTKILALRFHATNPCKCIAFATRKLSARKPRGFWAAGFFRPRSQKMRNEPLKPWAEAAQSPEKCATSNLNLESLRSQKLFVSPPMKFTTEFYNLPEFCVEFTKNFFEQRNILKNASGNIPL
jgi:hypothetical protein